MTTSRADGPELHADFLATARQAPQLIGVLANKLFRAFQGQIFLAELTGPTFPPDRTEVGYWRFSGRTSISFRTPTTPGTCWASASAHDF